MTDAGSEATRTAGRDRWANWLLETRFGGDPTARDAMIAQVTEFRDRALVRPARLFTPQRTVHDAADAERDHRRPPVAALRHGLPDRPAQ
jgi:hypothetical protein